MTEPRKKLSKSACRKYLQCPASYDYYYNQRIQPIKVGSPLVFGNGIDAALNVLLLKSGDPMDAYRKSVAETELGKMAPNKHDYDSELLTDEIREKTLTKLRSVEYKGDDVDGLYVALFSKENRSDNQDKALDIICRAVLEIKAELMIKAYIKKVLPYIETVYNVQKSSGPGFLDATLGWVGRGKVIADHKTSGKSYPEDAVEYSEELAMYAAEEKITAVVYIVLIKNILKNRIKICSECEHVATGSHKTCDNKIDGDRCNGEWNVTIAPEADIQIVHGDVTPEMLVVASELQREVQRAVDNKLFYCNVGSCNKQFGAPCAYKDLKWKNSMNGLEKRPERKAK